MKNFIALRQSQLTALLIIIVLSIWMFSGRHAKTEATTNKNDAAQIVRTTEISVKTRSLEAENLDKELILHGTTEPARSVTLRAVIGGRVVEVGAARDSRVQIVRAMPNGLWLSGLPEQVRVITRRTRFHAAGRQSEIS